MQYIIVNLHNLNFHYRDCIKKTGFKCRAWDNTAKYGMRPNASKRLADKKAWLQSFEPTESEKIREAHINSVMDILYDIYDDFDVYEYRLDWVDEFVVILSTHSSWQF